MFTRTQKSLQSLRSDFPPRALLLVTVLLVSACTTPVKLDRPTVATGGAGSMPALGKGDMGIAESTVKPAVIETNGQASQKLADLPAAIFFEFDSYAVTPEALPTVEGYAKVLKSSPSQRMLLEGHTDERGGREYNLALGQKRAEAVLRTMTVLGVATEQLEPVSMGEEQPAAQGADESAWSQNRRVQFRVR
jgi:peptidoglycan-associated lipoprotein